jgi:hypothetical protein
MIMHAVEVANTGLRIHLYSQDTDVLLLALRRVPQLGTEPSMIMGAKERRHRVLLQLISNKLGPDKASALINWHALTGCDTAGHIQYKERAKKDASQHSLHQTPLYLQHSLCLEKDQSHQLQWSRDVKNSCAHSSVLDDCT